VGGWRQHRHLYRKVKRLAREIDRVAARKGAGYQRRIEAAYRAELDAAADPKDKLAEIEDRLTKLRSPFRSAEAFWIEELIDPRDTRPLLCEFANLAAPLRRPGPSAHPMRP